MSKFARMLEAVQSGDCQAAAPALGDSPQALPALLRTFFDAAAFDHVQRRRTTRPVLDPAELAQARKRAAACKPNPAPNP